MTVKTRQLAKTDAYCKKRDRNSEKQTNKINARDTVSETLHWTCRMPSIDLLVDWTLLRKEFLS